MLAFKTRERNGLAADVPLNRKLTSFVVPTGRERTFSIDDIIVSKTDMKGVITYANDVFLRIASLDEEQAIGAPHSIIRHPDMPRAVFKLLWDRLAAGKETFAYVLNLASNGDHYWVFAHITPSVDGDGQTIGYHSSRRSPDRKAIDRVIPLYAELKVIEDSTPSRADGLELSYAHFVQTLKGMGLSYGEFVFTLAR